MSDVSLRFLRASFIVSQDFIVSSAHEKTPSHLRLHIKNESMKRSSVSTTSIEAASPHGDVHHCICM